MHSNTWSKIPNLKRRGGRRWIAHQRIGGEWVPYHNGTTGGEWVPYSPTTPNYVKEIEGSPYGGYPYYLVTPDISFSGSLEGTPVYPHHLKIYINKKKRTIVVKRGNQTVKVKCAKDTEWNERLGVLEALYQLNRGGTKTQAKKELQNLIDNARREE